MSGWRQRYPLMLVSALSFIIASHTLVRKIPAASRGLCCYCRIPVPSTLEPSDKLHNAIDADGTAADFINEHIGRMHVLQRHAVGYVIYALAKPVVAETLCCDKSIYLILGCKAKTADIRLSVEVVGDDGQTLPT